MEGGRGGRERERANERVGVCKGVSRAEASGPVCLVDALKQSLSTTVALARATTSTHDHLFRRGCFPPPTAASSSSVETPSLPPFRARTTPLSFPRQPRRLHVPSSSYRRQPHAQTPFSIPASYDCGRAEPPRYFRLLAAATS